MESTKSLMFKEQADAIELFSNEHGDQPMLNIQVDVSTPPLTDKFMDFNSRVYFAHRMDLISNDIYKIVVLVAAAFFTYMIALLQRRVGSMISIELDYDRDSEILGGLDPFDALVLCYGDEEAGQEKKKLTYEKVINKGLEVIEAHYLYGSVMIILKSLFTLNPSYSQWLQHRCKGGNGRFNDHRRSPLPRYSRSPPPHYSQFLPPSYARSRSHSLPGLDKVVAPIVRFRKGMQLKSSSSVLVPLSQLTFKWLAADKELKRLVVETTANHV
ncbi:hypothetical protein Tco_1151363 [Tanacetum coccineum]